MKRLILALLVSLPCYGDTGNSGPSYDQGFGIRRSDQNDAGPHIILRETRPRNGGVETQELILDQYGNERKVRTWSSDPHSGRGNQNREK